MPDGRRPNAVRRMAFSERTEGQTVFARETKKRFFRAINIWRRYSKRKKAVRCRATTRKQECYTRRGCCARRFFRWEKRRKRWDLPTLCISAGVFIRISERVRAITAGKSPRIYKRREKMEKRERYHILDMLRAISIITWSFTISAGIW